MAIVTIPSRRRGRVPKTPGALSQSSGRKQAPVTAPAPGVRPPTLQSDLLLSILIPTIPGREAKLAHLLARLDPQLHARDNVQLLVLRDNRSMSIGEKRNRMVSIAKGEYVVFVDDDDSLSTDYVASIVNGLVDRPDVLNFRVQVTGYQNADRVCRYGIGLENENLPHEYRRKSNHLMVWRRELATAVQFPDLSDGEDTAWANQICKLASTEAHIDRVLYTYQFDRNDK